MTATEKMVFSQAVVNLISERDGYLRRRRLHEGIRCIFCGGTISGREFLLMSDGPDGYTIGCVHCGSGRERVPSVNPFMFLAESRRYAN
ncbi:MAG: hypothetical protein PHW69_00825 [Elusimicrobiaceae bacterium]|nr:hypothetical protein [Elusimicrobiaceae bacterium]